MCNSSFTTLRKNTALNTTTNAVYILLSVCVRVRVPVHVCVDELCQESGNLHYITRGCGEAHVSSLANRGWIVLGDYIIITALSTVPSLRADTLVFRSAAAISGASWNAQSLLVFGSAERSELYLKPN